MPMPWQYIPRYVSASGPQAVAEMKPKPEPEPLPPIERFGAEFRCDTHSCPCCARWQHAYDAIERLLLTFEDILADRRDAALPKKTVQGWPRNPVTSEHQAEVQVLYGGAP